VAEEVAWAGLEDVPKVLPIALDAGHDRDALLEDFWGKIGYPRAATRPWERRSPPAPSVPRARSVSPPRVESATVARASSSSPPGLRLPRQAVRIKGWKGPLPPKRFTLPAVFGDFIGIVRTGVHRPAGGSASTAWWPWFEPEEAGASLAGPQKCWAGLCRAVMGLQREDRRRVHHVPIARHTIVHSSPLSPSGIAATHPSAPPQVPPDPRLPLSSSSTILAGNPFRRSLVDMVAKGVAAEGDTSPTYL
jgi:hypothetical protein